MKLFTKEIERKLEKAGPEGETAICKIFGGSCTWVIFGQDDEDPDILYAAADLGMQCIEFGGVRRSELEDVRLPPFNLPVQRDLYFRNAGKPLSFFLEAETLVGI